MPAIPNNLTTDSEAPLSKIDLATPSLFFAFNTKQQTLHIDNRETGPLTINILGDGVGTFACDGVEDKDVSAGFDIIVTNGVEVPVNTFTRRGYLGANGNNVTVTVTGTTTGSSDIWTTSN